MSLLSLPERIFRRLAELPLELLSVILDSQRLLPEEGEGPTLFPEARYQTEANYRGVRLRRKRREHRLRHAGYWSEYRYTLSRILRLPGPQGPIWDLYRRESQGAPTQRPEWAGNAAFVFGSA